MLLAFVCSLLFCSLLATNAEGCSIEDVSYLNGTRYIDIVDNYSGEIEQLKTENISVAYIEDPIYVNVSLKDNILTIYTTEKFADYEKEQTSSSIRLKINTICNGVGYINTLTYTIYLEDINTYEPVFSSDKYTFTFYDTVSEGTDIADFGNLYVTDYDIDNSQVDFEIEDNQYLKIERSFKGTGKEYYTKLITKSTIKGPLDVTYKITATDNGRPAKSSLATVTLQITEPTDISFTQSLYFGHFGTNGEVFVDNGPITIQNLDTNLSDVEVSIENDFSEDFIVEVSTSVRLLANDVNSLIKSAAIQNPLIVKLIATMGSSTTEASVLIELPNTETPGVCSIENIDNLSKIYQSSVDINDTHVGVVEQLQHLNLDDAYMRNSSYLEAHLENGYLVISTTKEFLNYEDVERKSSVAATLVTKCVDELNEVEYIVNIIDTNNHAPTFEEEHYQFLFYDNIPNSPDFDLNQFSEIVATDKDLTNTNITFSIEENDYLSLEYGGIAVRGTNRFYATLNLKQNVNAHFNETYLITAIDNGVPPLNSTAKLTLAVLRAIAPQFTQSLYKGFLSESNKIVVTNGPIALEDVASFDDLNFDISMEYDNYFRISVDDEITIEVQDDVDLTGLISRDNTTIIISLYAEGLTPEIYAESSLLLDLYVLLDNIETTTIEAVETETVFTDSTTTSTTTTEPGGHLPGLNNWLGYSQAVVIMFAAIFSGILFGLALLVWMIGHYAKKADAIKTEKI